MTKPRQISDFTKEQIILGLEKFDIIVDEEQNKKILLANLYDTDLDGECDKYKRILLKDHLNELFPPDKSSYTSKLWDIITPWLEKHHFGASIRKLRGKDIWKVQIHRGCSDDRIYTSRGSVVVSFSEWEAEYVLKILDENILEEVNKLEMFCPSVKETP